MATITRLLTAEEYARLPEEQERFSELVRGVIVPVNPPRFRHCEVCANVSGSLRDFVRPRRLGRVLSNDAGVITERDPDTVRGADVAFFSYARLPRDASVELYPPVAPDLGVEVKSPGDRWSELHRKTAEYLNAGVTVVCIVDYEAETVSLFYADKAVRVLTAADELTLPEVLPGLCVPVSELFE